MNEEIKKEDLIGWTLVIITALCGAGFLGWMVGRSGVEPKATVSASLPSKTTKAMVEEEKPRLPARLSREAMKTYRRLTDLRKGEVAWVSFKDVYVDDARFVWISKDAIIGKDSGDRINGCLVARLECGYIRLIVAKDHKFIAVVQHKEIAKMDFPAPVDEVVFDEE